MLRIQDHPDYEDELRASNALRRAQRRAMLDPHWNCQDPEHAGCHSCEPPEDQEE